MGWIYSFEAARFRRRARAARSRGAEGKLERFFIFSSFDKGYKRYLGCEQKEIGRRAAGWWNMVVGVLNDIAEAIVCNNIASPEFEYLVH